MSFLGSRRGAELGNIEPLVGASLQAAIVEIERVHIHVGPHSSSHEQPRLKKQRPPFGGLAPCAEATGGMNVLSVENNVPGRRSQCPAGLPTLSTGLGNLQRLNYFGPLPAINSGGLVAL